MRDINSHMDDQIDTIKEFQRERSTNKECKSCNLPFLMMHTLEVSLTSGPCRT